MIIVLSGAAGTGKSTVAHLLEERLGLHKNLKCTTRARRNDQDNDYAFVDEAEFFKKVRHEELIEFVHFHGNFYGIVTPRDEALVNCEPTGAMHVRKWAFQNGLDCRLVFLDCPEEIRVQRTAKRGDDGAKIRERVEIDRYFEVFRPYYDVVVDASGTVEETFEGIRKALGR